MRLSDKQSHRNTQLCIPPHVQTPVPHQNCYCETKGKQSCKLNSPPDCRSLIQTPTCYPNWGSKSHPHITRQIPHHLAGARREYAVLTQSYGHRTQSPHTPLVSVQSTEVSCKGSAVLAFFGRKGRFPECKPFCKTSPMPNKPPLGFEDVLGDNSKAHFFCLFSPPYCYLV